MIIDCWFKQFKRCFNKINKNIKYLINRLSVIAGPWQFGKQDQGFVPLWVARHFLKKKLSSCVFLRIAFARGHPRLTRDARLLSTQHPLRDLAVTPAVPRGAPQRRRDASSAERARRLQNRAVFRLRPDAIVSLARSGWRRNDSLCVARVRGASALRFVRHVTTFAKHPRGAGTVSYTHLTLPTILLV